MKTYIMRKTYTYYYHVDANTADEALSKMEDVTEVDLDLDAAVTDWEVAEEIRG
jgi:hypothetical protein